MTAWIEIYISANRYSTCTIVAVFMTAWIEMGIASNVSQAVKVAVFMTAWIEIKIYSFSIANRFKLQSS